MIGKTNAGSGGGVKEIGVPYVPYSFNGTFTESGSVSSYPYYRYYANGTLTAPIVNNFCTIDDYVWNANSHYVYYIEYMDSSIHNLIKNLISQISLDGLIDGEYEVTLSFVDDAHIINGNPTLDMLAEMDLTTALEISNGNIRIPATSYILCANNLTGSGRLYLTSFMKSPY